MDAELRVLGAQRPGAWVTIRTRLAGRQILRGRWETGASGAEGKGPPGQNGGRQDEALPVLGGPQGIQRGMMGTQAGGMVGTGGSDSATQMDATSGQAASPPTKPQQPHQQPETQLLGNHRLLCTDRTAQTRLPTCQGRALPLATMGQSQREKQKRKPDKQFPYPTFSTFNYF